MIEPEVTRFYKFTGSQNKSLLANLKISTEYQVKKLLCSLGGKKTAERFASAYTVLCTKQTETPKLF
jgi:hypothetical protein